MHMCAHTYVCLSTIIPLLGEKKLIPRQFHQGRMVNNFTEGDELAEWVRTLAAYPRGPEFKSPAPI